MRAYKRRVGGLWLCSTSLWLCAGLACAAEPEASPDALPQPSAPSSSDESGFSLGAIGWTLAPIRWAGNVGASLRISGGTNQPRRFQDLESANVQGRSYIWQPWFAQISAGLGLVTSVDRYSTSVVDSGGASNTNRSRSTTATGNFGLALLPVSRFPFQLNYDVTDSRTSGELAGSDFQARRLSVRQSYRPQLGNTSYVVNYDRSALNSASFGNDTLTALGLGVTHAWNAQHIDVNASRTRNVRGNTGESALLERINARHNYRPEGTLSIDTQASFSGSDLHLANSGLSPDTRSRFYQLNTVGTWRPEEGDPLSVIGSARMFRSEFSGGGSDTNSNSLAGNLAANYRWTPRTTLFGSAGLTHLKSEIDSRLLTSQAAGITHTADAINVGAYKYLWNAGANLANQTGNIEGAQRNISSNVGHTLMRTIPVKDAYALSLSVGQAYTVNHDNFRGLSQTLTHNATASLRGSPTPESNAYISLTLADARTYGANENSFQIINLQSSGQVQLGRYSFASANLTVQGTRQSSPTAPANGFQFNNSGNLTYNHTRAFNVPQLRYTLLYTANQSQFQSRFQGDINAPREQISQSLEQRFDYKVGRVEMRLTGRVASIEGRRDWLMFFNIIRRFGDF